MFYTYVIQSTKRNYLYVGLTNNLDRRFQEHNLGKNKTTKAYSPFTLILYEQYPTRILTREREKYLKSGTGKEFIKRLL